jgi:hypothetical protein
MTANDRQAWVIYDQQGTGHRPRYVARAWHLGGARVEAGTVRPFGSDELEPLRARFAAEGLHPTPRKATDRPEVVETWL